MRTRNDAQKINLNTHASDATESAKTNRTFCPFTATLRSSWASYRNFDPGDLLPWPIMQQA